MPSRSPPIADGWPRGAVPPPFGANPPPFGSMPPPFGAMPPPFGAPFYAELRPGAPRFDARAAAIHGLDQGKLAAEGLSQRASCEALAAWVAARTKPRTKPSFVGHNAPFDWSFVSYAYAAEGLPNPFGYKAHRTKALATGALGVHWFDSNKEVLAERLRLPAEDSVRSTVPTTTPGTRPTSSSACSISSRRGRAEGPSDEEGGHQHKHDPAPAEARPLDGGAEGDDGQAEQAEARERGGALGGGGSGRCRPTRCTPSRRTSPPVPGLNRARSRSR